MRKFWSFISNGNYSVGCSGQTVYLFDSVNSEIARFKDIKYGYDAAFSPVSNTFAVKSTGMYFGVYDADSRSLIHKVKYSNVDVSQDDGFCFSPDGRYFINVERQKSSVNSAISIYETANFSRAAMFCADDDRTEPSFVEFGDDGVPYVLGFTRGEDGVINGTFAARLGKGGLEDMRTVSRDDYDFHCGFKRLEMRGFTEKSKEWSSFKYAGIDMMGMENQKHPFKELWERSGK